MHFGSSALTVSSKWKYKVKINYFDSVIFFVQVLKSHDIYRHQSLQVKLEEVVLRIKLSTKVLGDASETSYNFEHESNINRL